MKYSVQCLFLVSLLSSCMAQIEPCSKTDPQINICIKNLFNSIYQNARFGRSEFNPIANDVIQLDTLQMESQELDLKAFYESILAKGFKDLNITEVRSNLSVSVILVFCLMYFIIWISQSN